MSTKTIYAARKQSLFLFKVILIRRRLKYKYDNSTKLTYGTRCFRLFIFKLPDFFYQGLTCAAGEEPLLEGTNPVPDSHFTASSEYDASYAAPEARMSTVIGWNPTEADMWANPPTCYLQVCTRVLNCTGIINFNRNISQVSSKLQ